jgi:hypothetical protein
VFFAGWFTAFSLLNDHSFGAFSPVGVWFQSLPREATMCHEFKTNINISLLLELGDFNGNHFLFFVEIGPCLDISSSVVGQIFVVFFSTFGKDGC